MRQKIILFTLLFIVIHADFVFGESVISTGRGDTCKAARKDAIQKAIQHVIEANLKSRKLNVIDLSKKVNGDDTCANYEDVSTAYADGQCELTLKADINDQKIQGRINEIIYADSQLKEFHETKFDNKRIVVLYKELSASDKDYREMAVRSAVNLIEEKLASYGFRVFLPEQLERIRARISEMVLDEKTANDIARQEDADAVVMVSIDSNKTPTTDGYYIISSNLNLSAFDPTVGDLFANESDRISSIARDDNYHLQEGLATAVTKIGTKATDRLVEKIIERFNTKRAKFVVVIFKNFASKDQDRLEDVIESTGWKYRIARQTGDYMETEVFSDGDPTSVRNTLRNSFKKAGISFTNAETAGSRVVFDGTQ